MSIYIKDRLINWARSFLGLDEFVHLQRAVIELNDVQELKKVFGWNLDPVLDDPAVLEFKYVEDVNLRKLKDAESLATIVRNTKPKVCLDIGTGFGHSTMMMSINAPTAQVYTVNIPPEEFEEGGELTTIKLERNEIGSYYREQNLDNITQIFANTLYWEPNIGLIDIAFIDGCHDSEFVYNDTRKVLKYMKTGSFILWHDFNLDLVKKYHWIHSVCLGVEKLYKDGLVNGRIFHVIDSWIGVYRVP